MRRDEAIQQLRAGRKELSETIQGLTEEDLLRAKAINKWTLKDLLAHIASWDEEIVRVLQTFTLSGDSQYTYSISDAKGFAQWNEDQVAQRAAQTANDAVAEFESARRDLIQVVEGLTDPVLNRSRMTSWGTQATGFELIMGQVDHDREHAEQVRSYRKKIERWARARQKLTEKRKTKKT